MLRPLDSYEYFVYEIAGGCQFIRAVVDFAALLAATSSVADELHQGVSLGSFGIYVCTVVDGGLADAGESVSIFGWILFRVIVFVRVIRDVDFNTEVEAVWVFVEIVFNREAVFRSGSGVSVDVAVGFDA